MKKIKIKGNDYVMVNERVKQFHIDYPNGKIETELIEFTERCITRTKVTPDVANPERYFTGIAYEKEGSNFINKTSFIEQCETSSCGRALGFLGLGIDESIASYDEVSTAIDQQKSKPEPKPEPKTTMKVDDKLSVSVEDIKEKFDGAEIKNLINFGKHNGKDWSEVPESYVVWVAKNSAVDWQKVAAQEELDRRSGSVPIKDVVDGLVDEFEGMPS